MDGFLYVFCEVTFPTKMDENWGYPFFGKTATSLFDLHYADVAFTSIDPFWGQRFRWDGPIPLSPDNRYPKDNANHRIVRV